MLSFSHAGLVHVGCSAACEQALGLMAPHMFAHNSGLPLYLPRSLQGRRWSYSIVQRSWLLVLVVCVVFTSGDTMLQLFVYKAVLMASLICLIVFNSAELVVVVWMSLSPWPHSLSALEQCSVWLAPQLVLLSHAAALVWVPLGGWALAWL